jgi:hypothetical protein
VIVEIPDHVISALKNPGSTELQQKALGIAMNATWNQRVKYRNFQFSSWSSAVVVDVDPAGYGAAGFRAGDGCSAWIVESPLAAKTRKPDCPVGVSLYTGQQMQWIYSRRQFPNHTFCELEGCMSKQLPRITRGGMVAIFRSNMKRAVGILISCLTAWALLPDSNATNYYVNPSGSDTNPGTQTLPWQTIDKVNSTAFSPGDEILFQGGQTFTGPLVFTGTSAGTAASPIVVSSYGTGVATISSSGDGIDIMDTQGFSISNLTVNGVNHTTNTGGGIVLINDLAGNVKIGPITIDSVTVSNFGYDGISIYGLNGSSGWNAVTISNSTVLEKSGRRSKLRLRQ